jgi:hypothetical protein
MPQFNYNINVGTSNILNRILLSTDINNLSRSSTIRSIAESAATDISFVLTNTASATTQFYSETATGKFLDAKAFDIGISRNLLDSLQIYATDLAIQLQVLGTATFGTYLSGTQLQITAGDRLAVYAGKYSVTALESITLLSSDTTAYISISISPIDPLNFTSGIISLNQGNTIQLDNTSPIGRVTNKIQIAVQKSIVLETNTESDDALRTRVIAGKSNLTKGTPPALGLILDQIPDLLGYSFSQNTRNDNSIDINIVTQSLIDGTNFSFLPNYISNLARQYFPTGTDVVISFPNQLQIYIQYQVSNTETIPDDTIKDVIQTVINSNYVYSSHNVLSITDIQNQVKTILPSLVTFNILQISGLDINIQEFVYISNSDLLIPDVYYAYISNISNITRVTNA